jgi:hypothetical protein
MYCKRIRFVVKGKHKGEHIMATRPAKKRKMWRPARDISMVLRVNSEERATFKRSAAAMGLTVSSWMRMTLWHAVYAKREQG